MKTNPHFPGEHPAVMWNPWNRVVQDHRDGTVHPDLTDRCRAEVGLPVPWSPDMALPEYEAPGGHLGTAWPPGSTVPN